MKMYFVLLRIYHKSVAVFIKLVCARIVSIAALMSQTTILTLKLHSPNAVLCSSAREPLMSQVELRRTLSIGIKIVQILATPIAIDIYPLLKKIPFLRNPG